VKYSKVFIDAFGYELAPNVVTSEDLEQRLAPVYEKLHVRKGQLEVLTGIFERRFWDVGYKMSDGALAAARKVIANSDISPKDIGMLIYCGVCRDNLEPATACAVADGLGLGSSTEIYDISNACLGVLNGMIQVANAIELGYIRAGLVVSCESSREIVEVTIDRLLHAKDMNLFKETIATLTGGSGAVAVLLTDRELSPHSHQMLHAVAKNATAHHGLCLWGPGAGRMADGIYLMKTDSVGVLQHGVALGIETYNAFKAETGWKEPDKIVCHQVGSAHQKTILESIGVSKEKDFTTFQYLGNIGTVSLPITAAIAHEREFLNKGDNVGFFGIGSGLNCLMLGIRW
jgi:3-oxoacyl-[acyl-carrier-protein] synthase-3